MSLVAYAESDDDSSDNESSEVVSPSVAPSAAAPERVLLAGPAVLGQLEFKQP